MERTPDNEGPVLLTTEEVEQHLTILRLNYDMGSPFFGIVRIEDLMAMPPQHQQQVYEAMPDDLRKMVEAQNA